MSLFKRKRKEYRKALIAVNGSIKKWEGIELGSEIDLGMDNCALCQEFFTTKKAIFCKNCPVFKFTGDRYCRNSPYIVWEISKAKICDSNVRKILAKNEADFLKEVKKHLKYILLDYFTISSREIGKIFIYPNKDVVFIDVFGKCVAKIPQEDLVINPYNEFLEKFKENAYLITSFPESKITLIPEPLIQELIRRK